MDRAANEVLGPGRALIVASHLLGANVMVEAVPSLSALESGDDRRLAKELRPSARNRRSTHVTR